MARRQGGPNQAWTSLAAKLVEKRATGESSDSGEERRLALLFGMVQEFLDE